MGEKGDRGQPQRLNTWRITSQTKDLIAQAAGLYGGEPKPWEGQWEVVTTTAELPVLVMPGYSFRQGYEFRTSPTLVERRCDGIEMEDGKPCKCNADGVDKCSLITRLTVALPELTTMLGWRLETKGQNAARELLASMDLVQGVAHGRPFVPAKLRMVERRGNVDGQAVRYVVPIIDVSVRYSEVLQLSTVELPSLPSGYTPVPVPVGSGPGGAGVSLEAGLAAAETQTSVRTARSAAPLPATDDDIAFGTEPVPVPDESGATPSPSAAVQGSAASGAPEPSSDVGNTYSNSTSGKAATKAQKDKMNVLVGQLRQAGYVTTEQLWANLAKARGAEVEVMVELLNGRDADGLHWAPLREDLTRGESNRLIDWLQRVEEKATVAA